MPVFDGGSGHTQGHILLEGGGIQDLCPGLSDSQETPSPKYKKNVVGSCFTFYYKF